VKRDYILFIKDILNCIQSIEDFIGNMSYEEFINDDKTATAVAYKLQNIGEAAKNVPRELRLKHKTIPWKKIAGMRDKIAHFYFGIDYLIVWNVVKEELPAIKPKIEEILSEQTQRNLFE